MLRPLLLGFAALAPFASLALAFLGQNIFVALAPLFFSHGLLLYATLTPNCAWWGPVVTSFQTRAQEVWLTIDDGPTAAHTLALLELLKQHDARATFFVIGERAEAQPHLITEILAHGHSLANHTRTHPRASFWCAGPARLAREIDGCAETLRSAPDRPARYFRSPVGMANPFLHPALTRRGLRLIGWSVRGLDTIARDPARVADRIEKELRPGAIILLHEGQRTRRRPEFNRRCLELTLERLAARGYRCVIPRPEQLQVRGA